MALVLVNYINRGVFQHLTCKHSYVGLARLEGTSGLTQQLLTDLLQRTQLSTNHTNNSVRNSGMNVRALIEL